MKLLLIEDDREAAGYLQGALSKCGYTVDHVVTGRDGLLRAGTQPYDVIILDRMLPEIDGLTILKTIRSSGTKTPVLLLTALASVGDRVEGLEAGGDDYLVKPFAVSELVARLNALRRRPPKKDVATKLAVDDLEMDLIDRTVTRGSQRIELQPREFKLLEFLLRHTGRVVTRTMLLEGVWGFRFDPKTNIVEAHISRLRSKVAKAGAHDLIQTVRGTGYILRGSD